MSNMESVLVEIRNGLKKEVERTKLIDAKLKETNERCNQLEKLLAEISGQNKQLLDIVNQQKPTNTDAK